MPDKFRLAAFLSFVSVGFLAVPGAALALSLEDAVKASLTNSLSLSASRNNWAAARDNIDTARSTKEWRATGTLSGTHSKTDSDLATRDGFLDSQSGSATLKLARNLYDGGQQDENLILRTLQRDIAEARYLAAEQHVILSASEAYLNVLRASREVALNDANLVRLGEHVAAAQARLEAGAATKTQVAQAEARLSRAQTTLISSLAALSTAEDAFQTLTGLAAEGMESDIAPATMPATLLEADDLARNAHPDITLANLNLAASGQEFRALLASLRPTVAFSLSANETMAEGSRSDKTELSANLTLSSPLMPTGSVRAKARSLSSSLEATKMERADTLRQVSLNVRNRYRELEAAQAQMAAVEAELAASQLVAEGITTEFQFGQKTTLDVLDAEQDVSDAELRMINARHAIFQAGFRLQAAMGQLTASALGMADQLGPLDDMPVRDVKYKSYMPLDVDWDAYNRQDGVAPVEDADTMTSGGNAVIEDSSAADIISPEPEIKPEDDFVAVATILPEPVDQPKPVKISALSATVLPVNAAVSELESLAIPLEKIDLVPAIESVEGIVWQIQTSDIP
jgi:outer membrane protein